MQRNKVKALIKMLIILGIIFGLVIGYKIFMGIMFSRYAAANKSPVITVSATTATYQEWQPQLKAVGSLRAVKGVNVTSELAGMVKTIYFKPGTDVKENDLLVELNIDSDVALLESLQAQAELNQINFNRDNAQYFIKAVSKAVVDTDVANLKSSEAQVSEQAAIVNKKIIRAPFSGRLGVSAINPGQYINPGDTIVNLQALNPIYADFYLPQQEISKLKVGLPVTVTTDTYPKHTYKGVITTIEPQVDVATRNIRIEATLDNPDYTLLPGMFVTVVLNAGEPQQHLTLPQAAISFNPYGEIVYIIQNKGTKAAPKLTAMQQFVKTGETRGDQITVLEGLKKGDWVVTAGQLKLKNGSSVKINNKIVPNNNPAPIVSNED